MAIVTPSVSVSESLHHTDFRRRHKQSTLNIQDKWNKLDISRPDCLVPDRWMIMFLCSGMFFLVEFHSAGESGYNLI